MVNKDKIMTEKVKRALLKHYLAALAYRTQKALRGAPKNFGSFSLRSDVRTPQELVQHMTSVIGYARTFFIGGEWHPKMLSSFDAEIDRFHDTLKDLGRCIDSKDPKGTTFENLLQGPLSDAMTHAGQLAMLRRLAGSPVKAENFIYADVNPKNLSRNQPKPVAPDSPKNTRPVVKR